ncbi:hypothetical protein A2303_07025 [Candidatus Falkowbacteria bacterium RIFOXYB2_FULL_47_14]|uniref:Methionine gamma-lyase n=1 Tax=Candidatus Falkowbacteria bacterium RIFOXYA2_FULL_47_19 TaxID=1797994 RepID=A0A1F5SGC8_9BACT|nr:MAG: hypothetical protein A2227_00770 [Candidatus Falkowbacteria bacterium RIFOXYA2_FULL_47_19]OGF34906.1 MAG: hypothetical protein A2468_06730 [Candidatus Falkowbacteria bacterium RIFOXYC2_FULL_46_15]OGF43621.1 MAG: hypothetical protein A2303_07025 [Candidatus Falkowbacteria bacterium RIFOXYB2_FULL_47_14]
METKRRSLKTESLIVHGSHFGKRENGPLVHPIYASAPFQFKTAREISDVMSGKTENSCVYTRCGGNPNITDLEERLALLENGTGAIATSSGMAAIAATVMTFLRPGDNFVACATAYGGTHALFDNDLKRYFMKARFVARKDYGNSAVIEKMIDHQTRFLYAETVTNPVLDVIDISFWAEIANKHKIPLITDNTFATPYLLRPLDLGANIVVHSATKYINGHGDVTAGAIVCRNISDLQKIRNEYMNHFGPMLSPRDAHEIVRGLKSLHLRMERFCKSAKEIAEWLQKQEMVNRVYYPGLPKHPGHHTALRQMDGKFGGMVSFELKGGQEKAWRFIDHATAFINSVSLGDLESLITHPWSTTHVSYRDSDKLEAGITPGFIRLSIGAEHPDDLIANLEEALKKAYFRL